jgi:hypothetical protein
MYNQCIVHTSPRLQNSSTCGHAQAFSEIAVSRPHALETGLDATCRNPSFGLATKAKGVARVRA